MPRAPPWAEWHAKTVRTSAPTPPTPFQPPSTYGVGLSYHLGNPDLATMRSVAYIQSAENIHQGPHHVPPPPTFTYHITRPPYRRVTRPPPPDQPPPRRHPLGESQNPDFTTMRSLMYIRSAENIHQGPHHHVPDTHSATVTSGLVNRGGTRRSSPPKQSPEAVPPKQSPRSSARISRSHPDPIPGPPLSQVATIPTDSPCLTLSELILQIPLSICSGACTNVKTGINSKPRGFEQVTP